MAFGLITGNEAATRLSDRTPSERCVGCELDGRYANLGFCRLKLLASLDRAPRNTLPPLTLDVEHFARAKLVLEVAERPDGDGRPAFSGHLAALYRRRRNRRAGEINALSEDACGGAPVEMYALPADMPLWVYPESVALSVFHSFVRSVGRPGHAQGMLPATSNEGIEERFCSPFKFDHRPRARGHRDRRKRQRHARPF